VKSISIPVFGWFILGFSMLMCGCASTELVDIRGESPFSFRSLKSVLVISVGSSGVQRRVWENAFSAGFAGRGVAAVSSYHQFPDSEPDNRQLDESVHRFQFDAVIIIRRLASDVRGQAPQAYSVGGLGEQYGQWRQRFAVHDTDMERAGYADSQKTDVRSIDVWSTDERGRLIWGATSRTADPNSVQEIGDTVVETVLMELAKKGIVALAR
jgi:hypothetical protein